MNNPNYTRNRFFLTLALVAASSFLACAPRGKKPEVISPGDLTAENDAKAIERMERAHAKALAAPGSVKEAIDFSIQLSSLHRQKIAERHKLAASLVEDAAQALDKAREAAPDDAADLLGRKGDLYLAAGRNEDSTRALRESMAARPTLRVFALLAKTLKEQNKAAEVEGLCKKALPAMKSDESRYALLDDCIKYSGAASPDAGLRWAPAKDIAFYKARRREVEARLQKTTASK